MIPYDTRLRLHQLDWYWSNSIILSNRETGKYLPYTYAGVIEDTLPEVEEFDPDMDRHPAFSWSVQRASDEGVLVRLQSSTSTLRVPPATLFERGDETFITYRPSLGYVRLEGEPVYLLLRVQSHRGKGLSTMDSTHGGRPNLLARRIDSDHASVPVYASNAEVHALCDRMNMPPPLVVLSDIVRTLCYEVAQPGDFVYVSHHVIVRYMVTDGQWRAEVHSAGEHVANIMLSLNPGSDVVITLASNDELAYNSPRGRHIIATLTGEKQ